MKDKNQLNYQRTTNEVPITLGTIIKVHKANCTSDSSSTSDLPAKSRFTRHHKKDTKTYSGLHRHLTASSYQRTDDKEPLSLGTIIKVDNGSNISFSYSSSPSELSDEPRLARSNKKVEKAFSRLPSQFDPNLGLFPYLPPLETSHEPRMNQAWKIAPYFLDILPQSPCSDLNDCILLLGGSNPYKPDDLVLSSSIFEFHISSQTWRYYGNMMEPRCYHAACFVGSFLYITGGYSSLRRREGEMLAIPSTDKLDIRTTLWERCADMKTARACHSMVALKKHLFVFGGRNSFGSITASVEMYDMEKDFWIEITRLPHPTMGLSATCVNDQIWVIGGITEEEEKAVTSDVHALLPSNKSWLVQRPLPGPHAFASCATSKDTIWVVGGLHSSEKELVSCPCIWRLKWRNRNARWKMVASLSAPIHSSCSVLCGKELYVFGGVRSKERKISDTVEIFNTETGTLRKGVSLPAAITGSSAIFLESSIPDTKTIKRVKNLNELAPKLVLDVTKPIQNHISSSSVESAPENDQQSVRSNLEYDSEKKHELSENILHLTEQKERASEMKQDQSSVSYSDTHESDASKSSQEKYETQSQFAYYPEQTEHLTTKAHLYLNHDRALEDENKNTFANHHLRKMESPKSSSSEKYSDNGTQLRAELYRRNFLVKQISAQNEKHSKDIHGFRRNQYVTTLEVPLNANEASRKHYLNSFQSMKTEMTIENRKWKPIEICFSDSNSGSSSESHNFKLYSPPPEWKMWKYKKKL